jgi:Protein of unknown function (DUF3987)
VGRDPAAAAVGAAEAVEMSAWPEPLGAPAYHGLAGEIVRAIEPHSEADPAAILVQLHVGFGNLIGRSAHFVAEADRHYTNLFAAQVGETAKARKGASWGRVKALLREADGGWADGHIVGGLSSGEGLINAVRDDLTKHDSKGEPYVIPGVQDKRLLVQEDEFSSVLKQAGRETNILASVLRQAWDRGDLRNMTVDGRRATGAHISINGHITRAELLRQINETDAANGFGNRFLWYCARRSKLLPDGGGPVDAQTWAEVVRDLEAAAAHARRVGEVGRDHDAGELWHEVYEELSEGKPGLLGSMIARAEAQVMRLALVYALLQRQQVIARVHLEAALEVWRYCEESARYVFGERLGDPTADTILQALRANPGGLTREQIRSDVLGRHKPAMEVSRALGALLERGLAVSVTEETGGRPAERWHARAGSAGSAERSAGGDLPRIGRLPRNGEPSDADLDLASLDATYDPADWAEDEIPYGS